MECRWCESKHISKTNSPVSKYSNGTIAYLRKCKKCHTYWSSMVENLNWEIDYDDVQAKSPYYRLHGADFNWLKFIHLSGEEKIYTEIIIDFLLNKTMDTRYSSAIKYLLEASQKKQTLDILEIGCNHGYFGIVAKRLGHRYQGIDVQTKAIEEANVAFGPYYQNTSLELLTPKGCKYDLIVSFEVIEHVLDPKNFLQSALEFLNDKGRLILTTPNGDIVKRNKWITDIPPIHQYLFTHKSFRYLESKGLVVNFDYKHASPTMAFLLKDRDEARILCSDPSSEDFYLSAKNQGRFCRLFCRRSSIRLVLYKCGLLLLSKILPRKINTMIVVNISKI